MPIICGPDNYLRTLSKKVTDICHFATMSNHEQSFILVFQGVFTAVHSRQPCDQGSAFGPASIMSRGFQYPLPNPSGGGAKLLPEL